jgi:hypothetical protein
MDRWRWRVVLALIGLTLLISSACLVASSRLQIERRRDRDVVPIEVPSSGSTSESLPGTLSIPVLAGVTRHGAA